MTTQDCIFCKIGRGEVPSEKVYDDGTVFAVRDINPRAPVHVLVIPHRHVGALMDEPAEGVTAAAQCLQTAPQIAAKVGVEGGYRLVVNQGPNAGQEVPHFHLHILAGRRLGPMG